MKIRTLTFFISGFPDDRELNRGERFLAQAKQMAQDAGFEVQTLRLALGSLDAVLFDPQSGTLESFCARMEAARVAHKVDFFNLGRVRDGSLLERLGDELIRHPGLSTSADGATFLSGRHDDTLMAAARLTLRLSRDTPQGLGNFSFCASFCMGGGTPFFPSGFAPPGPSAFAVGLENSGILCSAMKSGEESSVGLARFAASYSETCRKLEGLFLRMERDCGVPYLGLDTSLVPSLDPEESLALAFKRGGTPLGTPGSLGLSAAVTQVLQDLPVRKTGYCGLMLPVLEDAGLCALADNGKLSLPVLLAMSSVCGVGLDTVPIPGEASESDVMRLYADAAGLALKWNKPLSVRLFPVKGRKAGDQTDFHFPHVGNCRVFATD